MKIAILTTLHSDYEKIANILINKSDIKCNNNYYINGNINNNEIILTECGIGKVNATIKTVEFINAFNPDYIISTGIAENIDSSLNDMDIIVSNELTYYDTFYNDKNENCNLPLLKYKGDEKLINIALSLNNKENNIKIYSGLICSGDKLIENKKELSEIKKHFSDSLAIDNESCAIAQTCYIYNVPFVSFRIISDIPGNTENHQEQYNDFWKELADKSFNNIKLFLENIK